MRLIPKVLILGGHCKVALLLTPLLLARGWDVTSLTNNPEHRGEILGLQKSQQRGKEGRVSVLVANLEQIDTDVAARALLDRVEANYVIWMAGTGCRGVRTIDSEELKLAVKQMIVASFSSSKVSKFLMVSYLSNRRKKRHTSITDEQRESIANASENELPTYAHGLEAEEFLDSMTAWRRRQAHLPCEFQSIQVTTSSLSDARGTGTVALRPEALEVKEEVSRQDVAEVIAQLLARSDTDGRYCVARGEEDIDSAIDKAVQSQESAAEGGLYRNVVGGFVE